MDELQLAQAQAQQNYNTTQFQANNMGFNSASALQIRLDTDTVKQSLAPYFKGAEYATVMGNDNKPKQVIIWKGSPMCNDKGFQAIMTWLHVCLNPQVMQGNMEDRDLFGLYMMNLHADITEDLMINRGDFGIPLRQVSKIIHNLTDLAYPVLTRTLYNKERDGMNNTVKVQETMQSNSGGSGWSIPFFGGKK